MKLYQPFLLCTLVLLLSSLSGGCTPRALDMEQVSPKERIVLKFSHVVAETTPKGMAAKRFALLVHQRTQGRIEVQVYPDSRLYKEGEELKALQEGSIQMIAPATANLTAMFPQWQVFDLPFLFTDYAQVHRAMDSEAARKLFSTLQTRNMLGLTMWDNGFKQMVAKKSLVNVVDFQGLRFRIMPSRVLEAQFNQLGAQTTVLPFGEVYAALEAQTIDGAENTFSNIYSKKFYQVQPYLTISNHGYLGYIVLANAPFWHNLPPDLREILEQTLQEVTVWEREIASRQNYQDFESILQAATTKIHILTPEEKNAWEKALMPVYQKFQATVGEDLIAAFR
jgi:C4-dicarboxylate-binding protein DctP